MVKKRVKRVHIVNESSERLNSLLVENFVNLQKSMTHLALKFENMSDQMSKLLNLFEISARSFADKLDTNVPEIEKDREFLDKLNKLLEQNKLIAKGITLMEEKVRERVATGFKPSIPQTQIIKPASPRGYMPSVAEQEIPQE